MIRTKVDPKVIFDIASEYGLDILHSDHTYTSLAFNDVKFHIATHMFIGERAKLSKYIINNIADRTADQAVKDYQEKLRIMIGIEK